MEGYCFPKSMKLSLLFKIITTLSIVGILLAVYLLWQQLYRPAFQPCSINSWINCDAVITGPVAKTLGIPTPLYGLVGYIAIFMASLRQMKKTVLFTSAGGLAFCLWIAYIELVQLRVICPVCITCQLVMISIFALSVIAMKKQT